MPKYLKTDNGEMHLEKPKGQLYCPTFGVRALNARLTQDENEVTCLSCINKFQREVKKLELRLMKQKDVK